MNSPGVSPQQEPGSGLRERQGAHQAAGKSEGPGAATPRPSAATDRVLCPNERPDVVRDRTVPARTRAHEKTRRETTGDTASAPEGAKRPTSVLRQQVFNVTPGADGIGHASRKPNRNETNDGPLSERPGPAASGAETSCDPWPRSSA